MRKKRKKVVPIITEAIEPVVVEPEIAEKPYKAVFTIGNEEYRGEGETIREAILSISLPLKLGGKGVFKVQKGEKSHEIFMFPRMVRRFHMNKLYKELLAKRLSQIVG